MKIFITGGTGFIGQALIKKLLTKLHNDDTINLLVFNEITEGFEDKRIKLLKGDVREISQYKKELLESDYVYHLAANATFGNDIDYNSVNHVPTVTIVDILKESTVLKNFIFTSTIGAVDRTKKDRCRKPLNLESIPNPTSEYGKSKIQSEEYIKNSGINYTIIRPCWVYGANMRTNSHINEFVTMVYKKSPVYKIKFKGKVSLIYVQDLAQALANCIHNEKVIKKIYFGETEALSLGAIFKIIAEKMSAKKVRQIPLLFPSFLIRSLHYKLPLTVSNLFIDYLYAVDERFKADLLDNISVGKFEDTIHEVIDTNVNLSGITIITGANSGIGLELARLLKSKHEKLALVDLFIDNLSEFNDEIILKADISNYHDIDNIKKALTGNKIKCLINNAGVGYKGTFHELDYEKTEKIIDVNIKGTLYLIKIFLNAFITNKTTIVNIASSSAFYPLPNMSIYAASKTFLLNFSQALSFELEKTNTVITFSPSGTYTNFQKSAGVKTEEKGKGLLSPQFVAQQIIRSCEKKKKFVLLGSKTKILNLILSFMPRKMKLNFVGKLFGKTR